MASCQPCDGPFLWLDSAKGKTVWGELLNLCYFSLFSDPEAKILEYQTQQQKLLPQLAVSYAFHFTATSLSEFFHSSYSAILKRDFSLLPEVHSVCWEQLRERVANAVPVVRK